MYNTTRAVNRNFYRHKCEEWTDVHSLAIRWVLIETVNCPVIGASIFVDVTVAKWLEHWFYQCWRIA